MRKSNLVLVLVLLIATVMLMPTVSQAIAGVDHDNCLQACF